MSDRFVPLYYKRDLFVKLQKMFQGSRYVDGPKKGNVPLKDHKEKVSQVYVHNSNTHKSSNNKCFKCLGKGHIAS
ncbi:hypothetical protein CR513_35527, partial [Mucuna pruriens]